MSIYQNKPLKALFESFDLGIKNNIYSDNPVGRTKYILGEA